MKKVNTTIQSLTAAEQEAQVVLKQVMPKSGVKKVC